MDLYQMYDNSFSRSATLRKHRSLLINVTSKRYAIRLGLFAYKVNPYLDTTESILHAGYHWGVNQCEYATDAMFESRGAEYYGAAVRTGDSTSPGIITWGSGGAPRHRKSEG